MTNPLVPNPAAGAMLPVDPGNTLLAQSPSALFTTLIDTPAGQRLALTIRTSSATLTVLLEQPDAKAWAGNLTSKASEMSGSGLVVANGSHKITELGAPG